MIKTNNGEIKNVYFTTEFCTGDNLGINSIFGFVESFNAHYYCRICKNIKQIMQMQCKDDTEEIQKIMKRISLQIMKLYNWYKRKKHF